jgi:hypothetical protein
MTDSNQSSDPRRDPVTDDLPDTASEQELDDLLAHASELAGDLNENLGETDTAPASQPAESHDSADESLTPADLDEELARLETKTQIVANEIGEIDMEESSDASHAENPAPDDSPIPNASADHRQLVPPGQNQQATTRDSNEVPDFMRDMLADEDDRSHQSETKRIALAPNKPAPAPDELNPPSQRPTASAAASKRHAPQKPGVVGTGMLGVIGSPPDERDQSESQSQDGSQQQPASAIDAQPRPSTIARMARLAEPAAMNACQSAARILERIDRPLTFLGPRTRTLLGWLALATLATAAIVYLVALF